jgi:isopentenyl-diphosphate delta-isomerase type 1
MTMPGNADELLVVVNERNEEIGCERRCIIHEQHLLHRAVHVLIFNTAGKLLIQQRSALKDTFPLHWECVGGHLGPGETYEAAAAREVQEELGVPARNMTKLATIAACDVTGQEFVEVYSAVVEDAPNPDPAEVIAVELMEPEQLWNMMQGGRLDFSPSFINTVAVVRRSRVHPAFSDEC